MFMPLRLTPAHRNTGRSPEARHLRVFLLAVALAALGAVPAAAADLDDPVLNEQPETRGDVEAFWTDEMLKKAEPMPMPDPGNAEPPASVEAKLLQPAGLFAPATKPGETLTGFAPYYATPDSTLTAKWGSAPWVYTRYRLFPDTVATYTTYPYSTVGKLFFQIPGVGLFVCSGSVVTSQNRSVVWTAGHCVYSPPPGTFGYIGPHTNFLFIPSRRAGANPVGSWTALASATTVGWQLGLLEYDHGALIMNRGGLANNHIATDTGALGLLTDAKPTQHFHAIGYPQAPRNLAQTQPGLQFDGEHQEICTAATAGSDLPTGGPADPRTIGIGCDNSPGTSGGPWIVNFSGFGAAQNNLLNSVFSYRYTGPNPPENLKSYGPYSGSSVTNLWSIVQAFPVP